jgi:N-acetylmuramoyl-L-alanine amidase
MRILFASFPRRRAWYATAALLIFPAIAHATSPLNGRTIALDPGHGVIDFEGHIINSGKSNRNHTVWEHQLTLQMATLLGDKLEQEGARVIYTRTPFDYWRQAFAVADDNKARAKLANEMKADVYIAIHCDWDRRSRNKGVSTYYRTAASEKLGEAVHRQLIQSLHVTNRHLRHDTFTVLEQTDMPAILVETGFLSNRSEGKKLADPKYQRKIADAMLAGLRNYFGKNQSNP